MRVWLGHLIGPKSQSKSKSSSPVNPVQAGYKWICWYYVRFQQIDIGTAALIVQVQYVSQLCRQVFLAASFCSSTSVKWLPFALLRWDNIAYMQFFPLMISLPSVSM